VSSDHEQMRFFQDAREEVVPLVHFRRELRRGIDRRVDVAPQPRLGPRQRADDLVERHRPNDQNIDVA